MTKQKKSREKKYIYICLACIFDDYKMSMIIWSKGNTLTNNINYCFYFVSYYSTSFYINMGFVLIILFKKFFFDNWNIELNVMGCATLPDSKTDVVLEWEVRDLLIRMKIQFMSDLHGILKSKSVLTLNRIMLLTVTY